MSILKNIVLTILGSVLLPPAALTAQSLCPSGASTDKLICMIPQVYGPSGLPVQAVSFGGAPINTHFQNVLPDSLAPLNSSIGRQAAVLPLASPSSGITFAWDASAKTFVASTESLGPVLAERAETVGKHRISIGFSYQYFKFGDLDGVGLKNLPSMFEQQDDPLNDGSGRICSVNGDNQTQCGYIRDVVKTDNRVDLNVHQFTTFVTFGLTDRIDLSMAIPIETVRMGVTSNATIVDNLDSTGTTFAHTFPFRTGCGSNVPAAPCSTQSFSSVQEASGISDITLRVKGTAWKGERAGLAIGADVRVPTGDSLDFLGAGAAGVKPFIIWSYRSRISPHVSVGYEVNGSSQAAGDITTGLKQKLPGELAYSAGADAWITKRFTAGFDLIGQQVFQAHRISVAQVTEPAACLDSTGQCNTGLFAKPIVDPSVSQSTASYNVSYASVGGKFRPFSNLLITANVLLKLNNGGLGAKAIPLVGVSYTF